MGLSSLGLTAGGKPLDFDFDAPIEPLDVDSLAIGRPFRDHCDREKQVGGFAQPEGSAASELVVEDDPVQSEARGHHVAQGDAERLLAGEVIAFDPLLVEESLEK